MKLDPAIFLLTIILIIASVTDCISFRIPNWLTFPALAVGVSYFTLAKGYEGLFFSIAGASTGFAVLIVPYIIGGTGAGDVKLLAAVGSFLGARGILTAFILSCFLGGACALFLLASRGLLPGTFRRYGRILRGFMITRKLIYLPPTVKEKALKIRFGLAIALGTFSYLALGWR